MFPDFGERTVEIKHRGKIFVVPKLSILQYGEVLKIITEAETQLQNGPGAAALRNIVAAAGRKLWTVLRPVLPEKIFRDRGRFEYDELVELGIHLAFGTYLDDKIKGPTQKYYEPSRLPDYQFKAVRILNRLGAYSLETLLNEPASIFFALSDYVERADADQAVELVTAGVKAAFGNPDRLAERRGSLTIPNPNYSPADMTIERRKEMEEFLKSHGGGKT
ncbi:MAG: hypothetical protein PHH77_01070 [Victivallaceae bacterium]|nr:hypothetical protein [Victivallaceae bacterium]